MGSDIEYANTFDLLVLDTIKHGSLNSSSLGDGFIGVDALVESLSVEEVRDEGLDLGDTGGSTDHNEIMDLTLGEASIGEGVLGGCMHFLNKSMQSSSNLARLSWKVKSSPSARVSHSIMVVTAEERVLLAFSH